MKQLRSLPRFCSTSTPSCVPSISERSIITRRARRNRPSGSSGKSNETTVASALVEKYFDVLNVDIPKTSRQAYILVDHILQSQQDTLKVSVVLSVYHSLKVEASPVLFKVAPSSWDIYIPKGMFYHLRVPCGARDERFRDCGQVTLCISNRPADEVVRLHVLSRNDLTCLSRALYFDTAEGFGDWTVVISTNAGNVLRRAHKKNPPAFNAMVEKIKYVSDFMVSCITHAHRNYMGTLLWSFY